MTHHWETLRPGQAAPPTDLSSTFKLTAPPKCDIWRSKPEHNVFDAPAIVTRIKANTFKSMSVTVTARWKTLYDQAGLLIVFAGQPDAKPEDSKWIKAGVENFKGTPKLGVVGAYAYSDWSLAPKLTQSDSTSLKFVRDGTALWIYAVNDDGSEVGLRELTWAFLEDRSDSEIWVGVYTAKPTPDEGDESAGMDVTFENFRLETTAA